MFNFQNSILEKLIVHRVGNAEETHLIKLSRAEIDLSDAYFKSVLLHFFTKGLVQEEIHHFTSTNGDLKLNPVYTFVKEIFAEQTAFQFQTIQIANALLQQSTHSRIKGGDLFIVQLSNIGFEGKEFQGLGLFKTETKLEFVKTQEMKTGIEIAMDEGFIPEKIDKACFVLDTQEADGYRVIVYDKSNQSSEAKYWKNQFLNIEPVKDNYHHTVQLMDLTKAFVQHQLPKEFEVSKAEQIDLLNRSVSFFKTEETFNKTHFEQEVLQDSSLIDSFRGFNHQYAKELDLQDLSEFEISGSAVKKQARIFKSILKLDKNFHVYIHGNRELIEKGVDPDGRKFYKIYFNEEN
jgi:hypothetical protein